MNSLNINHIKIEKANATKLRYQKLRGHFKTSPEVKLPNSPLHEHEITKPLPKKQGITEENTMMAAIFTASPPGYHNQVIKVYHQSKSEKPRREKTETGSSSLQRSSTQVIKNLKVKVGCCQEEAGEGHFPEDHMSNEEFRKAIEDFIAKQQRFLREEKEISALKSNFDL